MVRDLIKQQPTASPKQIAEVVGCDITIVYEERRKELRRLGLPVAVRKVSRGTKAVAKAKEREAAQAKKQGRPNTFENIEKACATLLKFVGSRKDMCIAFDHNKAKVEIVWGEEIYNASTEEVIDVLMAIKKLDTHRQVFTTQV